MKSKIYSTSKYHGTKYLFYLKTRKGKCFCFVKFNFYSYKNSYFSIRKTRFSEIFKIYMKFS